MSGPALWCGRRRCGALALPVQRRLPQPLLKGALLGFLFFAFTRFFLRFSGQKVLTLRLTHVGRDVFLTCAEGSTGLQLADLTFCDAQAPHAGFKFGQAKRLVARFSLVGAAVAQQPQFSEFMPEQIGNICLGDGFGVAVTWHALLLQLHDQCTEAVHEFGAQRAVVRASHGIRRWLTAPAGGVKVPLTVRTAKPKAGSR